MKKIGQDFVLNNKTLFNHKKCVFIVGAGISVPSGIPDFRSPTGIFASLRQQLKVNGRHLFTYNFGVKEGSRQIYLKYISSLKRLCDTAVPCRTHHFLANFPRSRVYTQNIDGLEERAGMTFIKDDSTRGVYLHGNLSKLICQYCGFRREFTEEDLVCFEKGEEIVCSACTERNNKNLRIGTRKRPVGVMHPGIIHYQQVHPDGAFIGKMATKDLNCDLLIVIGTSLAVEGVKKLVKTFCKNERSEGKRILVNLTKPNKEWEDYFDYFYEGDCEEFVKAVESFTSMKKYEGEMIDVPQLNQSADVNQMIELNETGDSNQTMKLNQTRNLTDCCDNLNIQHNVDDQKLNGLIKILTPVKSQPLTSLESKIANLARSFSDENTLNEPVLEEALKNASNTEIQASFCSGLQEEIESIISNSILHADEE